VEVKLSALLAGRALPQKYLSGINFCRRISKHQDYVATEGLGKFKKKINYLIGTRTCDLLSCSIATHPCTLPHFLQ
jgi:hypothetical protein